MWFVESTLQNSQSRHRHWTLNTRAECSPNCLSLVLETFPDLQVNIHEHCIDEQVIVILVPVGSPCFLFFNIATSSLFWRRSRAELWTPLTCVAGFCFFLGGLICLLMPPSSREEWTLHVQVRVQWLWRKQSCCWVDRGFCARVLIGRAKLASSSW